MKMFLIIMPLVLGCKSDKPMTHLETYVWTKTVNGCGCTYDPVYCAQYADLVVYEYRMRGK